MYQHYKMPGHILQLPAGHPIKLFFGDEETGCELPGFTPPLLMNNNSMPDYRQQERFGVHYRFPTPISKNKRMKKRRLYL